MKNKTDDFRGLLYDPTLERELVMLFSILLPHLEESFAIEKYPDSFPDCFAFRNGEKVGIEFELYSSSFFNHNHQDNDNLTKCNIIICWGNNIPNTAKRNGKEFLNVKGHEIEIISLSKKAKSLRLIKYGKRPDLYRNKENFFEQLKESRSKMW